MRGWGFLSIFVFLLTSACAEGNSIYHNRPIAPANSADGVSEADAGSARIITVDAKQRHLLATRDGTDGWRICSEAAPDVFSALSASASLDADVTSRRGKAAAAIAESAGSIERTQTVNLLRESMYRTCERYLSGGLTKSSFVIQAARDQRTMLAVLAIEQLTRTVRPPSTILAPGGTSASVANSDSAAIVKQFSDEKTAAQNAAAMADANFVAAKKTLDCETITVAPSADPDLANWSNCVAARQTLADRKAAATSATERLDKVIDMGLAGGATVAGTTVGSNANGQGGGALSDSAITAVASAVKEIALNSGFDESLMFCVGYLSNTDGAMDVTVRNQCLQMLQARFNNDEAARGQLLRVNAMGVPITVSDYRDPVASDRATPVLRAYMAAKGLSDTERTRRVKLAGMTAVQLGLIADQNEISNLIYSAQAEASLNLLNRLREIETDPAAKAALNN